jgi:hypothetical protein
MRQQEMDHSPITLAEIAAIPVELPVGNTADLTTTRRIR